MGNNRQIGFEKEEVAANYLVNIGYHILCRNFYCKAGEIDIIATQENYLCFIEVKYRKTKAYGGAAYTISREKQKRICKSSLFYIKKKGIPMNLPFRYDVLLIENQDINLIQNAFSYCRN